MTTNLVTLINTHLLSHSSVGQGLSVSDQLGQLNWVLFSGSHKSAIKHFQLKMGSVISKRARTQSNAAPAHNLKFGPLTALMCELLS